MKNTVLSVLALLTLVFTQISAHGQNLTVLYSFSGHKDGGNPHGALLRDTSGNVYGTTASGGALGKGTVFRLANSATETVVHSFGSGTDGASPQAGLIADSAGNFYGTTSAGGTANAGTVFKITKRGTESVLYSFAGGQDGAAPQAALLLISGTLYGTTSQGGVSGFGTVFQVDATTGSEAVLYSFAGGSSDGANPHARLITDGKGNLYGTTSAGGASNVGTVFEITTAGTETPLYSFAGGTDGADPEAELVLDSCNNLYGTTNLGGTAGLGTAFKLDANHNKTILHSFAGQADGKNPQAGLVMNANGILYGTTLSGGTLPGPTVGGKPGAGTVFRLTTTGTESVLYTFSGSSDGSSPTATLILDSAGDVYSTTSQGGSFGDGNIFKLTTRVEKVLHGFGSTQNDGLQPYSRLVQDSAGNFYGTTFMGGTNNVGTIYRVDQSGNETVLHSFAGFDGARPLGGVLLDNSGNLYGTTHEGGDNNLGVVYRLGSNGHLTVLHSFAGSPTDGGNPYYVDLVMDRAGNLYGTTQEGGSNDLGTVFKISAAGVESVLYSFMGGIDGFSPFSGVILDNSGNNLLGTTAAGGMPGYGTVFQIASDGSESVLYNFDYTNGSNPYGTLALDNAGNLYGTTLVGGVLGYGTVFKLNSHGVETVLHSFTGTDGANPNAGVVLDPAGNIYGTTFAGGFLGDCTNVGCGTVFVIDNALQETVVHVFTGGADGGEPTSAVLLLSDGSLYGTATSGGSNPAKYGCCRGAAFNIAQ